MLDSIARPQHILAYGGRDLKKQFLHALQEVFGEATPSDNILISSFRHGDDVTKGFAIGIEGNNNGMPSTDNLLPNLLTPADLRLVEKHHPARSPYF